ncbi:rhomboid family intramembrane serine protease [Pseudoluteimonas lycopersici]|uniref:Rhomboid family intramembrane serine protease n=1 Tax=Pseudoluteimonas lycopersici TaxID=1324796 RepID=A0A516V491_9GAMM|nr:rhomboid family intramembrane serine protease [Lysobacter lycopersici]QDQ73352.1 rhomboid family intramembrane serine protease [Lysobacter lycopersici]
MPFNLPRVTKGLLIANIVCFCLQLALGEQRYAFLELWPYVAGSDMQWFRPWQLVTYAFLHDPTNFAHIAFNMLALFMFGAPLEYTWGEKRFFNYYMVCVVGAGICQLLLTSWMAANTGGIGATMGASGGVFGLLLAYGMLFPNQRVMLLIPPIPMKARTLVIVYGAIELLMGFTGLQPGVAHFAHLGGMLFGWLMIRYWRGQPPFGRRGPPRPRIVR